MSEGGVQVVQALAVSSRLSGVVGQSYVGKSYVDMDSKLRLC